jgi:AbrB family looped-hinge helix DNA binding protein
MEKACVTTKGQLVIPAKIRRRYGIKPGTKVYFVERNGEIVFQPATKDFVRSVCGMLKSDTSATKALLKERAKDKRSESNKSEKKRS